MSELYHTDPDAIPEKRCTKCGNSYPATPEFFHRNKGGLRCPCKACRHAPKQPVLPEGYKRCSACRELKPATPEFFQKRSTYSKDGLLGRCKVCSQVENRAYLARKPKFSPSGEGQKQCSSCKEWKPATSEFFQRSASIKGGFRYKCKECLSAEYRAKHPIKTKPIDIEHEGQKQCSTCKEWKPSTAEYFHLNNQTKDGFLSRCKVCCSDFYERNRDLRLAAGRDRYNNNPESKARHAAREKERRYNPETREEFLSMKRASWARRSDHLKVYYQRPEVRERQRANEKRRSLQ